MKIIPVNNNIYDSYTELYSKPDLNQQSRLGFLIQQQKANYALSATQYCNSMKKPSFQMRAEFTKDASKALCQVLGDIYEAGSNNVDFVKNSFYSMKKFKFNSIIALYNMGFKQFTKEIPGIVLVDCKVIPKNSYELNFALYHFPENTDLKNIVPEGKPIMYLTAEDFIPNEKFYHLVSPLKPSIEKIYNQIIKIPEIKDVIAKNNKSYNNF